MKTDIALCCWVLVIMNSDIDSCVLLCAGHYED